MSESPEEGEAHRASEQHVIGPLRDRVQDAELVLDRASLPTLTRLNANGAEVVVCSHRGRPKGRIDPRYDMAPNRAAMAELAPGVSVRDNLRFDPGEEANEPAFIGRLVDGFDYFVNDAFGACHRSHASIVGPPALMPSAAGRLLVREVEALTIAVALRGPGANGAHRCRRQAGQELLGWDESSTRPGRQPHWSPSDPLPGRGDHGPRSADEKRPLGAH